MGHIPWGHLPFDRSCPDLTAHAIRAVSAWLPALDEPLRSRAGKGSARAMAYLARVQNDDGSWDPLWFGNQGVPGAKNPVYGTCQVLIALADSGFDFVELGV